jgi:hypothetical protein
MVKASSNSVRVQYAAEVTYGTQNSGATPQELRLTSESLERVDSFKENPEITSDRTSRAGTVVDESAAGSINFAHSCSTYDEFIQSALFTEDSPSTSSFTNTGAIFNSTDNSLRVTSGSDFTNCYVGQIIEVTAANTAANVQVYKIVRKQSNLKLILGGNFVTTDSAASATIVCWRRWKNGAGQTQYTFEREHTDLTGAFVAYTGSVIDKLYLTSRAQDFVQGRMDIVCKQEARAAATGFAGTPTAAGTQPLISASTGVLDVWEGGPSGQTVTVSSSTDATPIVVTTATDHNLQTGDVVLIESHTTNTNANNVHSITRLSATTFSLQNRVTGANVAGNGAGAGASGTLTKLPQHACFAAFDFTIDNGMRSQYQLTEACGKDVASGSFKCSGTMSFFMEDQRLLSKIADNARTALTIIFKDTDGNQQAFDFPDVELQSQSGTGASGKDADIVPTIAWNAVKSSVESLQCGFSKP